LQAEGEKNYFPDLVAVKEVQIDQNAKEEANRLTDVQEYVLALSKTTFIQKEIVLGILENWVCETCNKEENHCEVYFFVFYCNPDELAIKFEHLPL
jgi:hypothetical protein